MSQEKKILTYKQKRKMTHEFLDIAVTLNVLERNDVRETKI